jgi:hypothetical protein
LRFSQPRDARKRSTRSVASARAPTRSAIASAVVAPASMASGIRSSQITPSILISAIRNVRSAVIPCGGIIASATRRNLDRTVNARFTIEVGGIRGGLASRSGMRTSDPSLSLPVAA